MGRYRGNGGDPTTCPTLPVGPGGAGDAAWRSPCGGHPPLAVVAASRWPYRGPSRSGGSGVAQL